MPRQFLNGVDLAAQASPSAPGSGLLRAYAKNMGARPVPHILGPTGAEYPLQSMIGRGKCTWMAGQSNSSSLVTVGGLATATGTGTNAQMATTNNHTIARRTEYLVTTPATTAIAGMRSQYVCWRGNAAGQGGFLAVLRSAPATGPSTSSTHRFFMGLRGSNAAPTDVEPSSLTNIIGIGYDAADTQLQFMTNDAAGTATKTSLGIAKPATDRANVWELILSAAPNASTVEYEFRDFSTTLTPTVLSGSISTDLPVNTQIMVATVQCSAGGTSSAVGVAFMNFWIETDT